MWKKLIDHRTYGHVYIICCWCLSQLKTLLLLITHLARYVVMPYKKVTYTCSVNVFRWPNDPRAPAAVPNAVVKVRWQWFPKWNGIASLTVPGISTATVIIAYPLVLDLKDGQDGAGGYGDYLVPQVPLSRIYQLLLRGFTAVGYPNQTSLGVLTDVPAYPAGPP
jgi:hypothetical protein